MRVEIRQGQTISAPFLPEPAVVILFQVIGDSFKLIARGENKGEFFDRTITKEQAESILFVEESSFKGDSKKAKIAVEDMSVRVADDSSPQARAVGFTMAMLQRRFASSLYAAKRSLERMKAKREEILRDPEEYRRKRIESKLPENYDDLPDDEQAKLMEDLESTVVFG